MPTYLWTARYTTEGVKGLMKDGGTKRRTVIKQLTEQLGGKLHSLHFAFGDYDVTGISEYPDNVTAMGLAMTVAASGAAMLTTTVLLTPEEMDAATSLKVAYRPPGA